MSLHAKSDQKSGAGAAVKPPHPAAAIVDQMSSAPGGGAEAPAENVLRCFRAADTALGILFYDEQRVIAFPYSHFLFADMVTPQSLEFRFATHRVTLTGRFLLQLLEEASNQRLEMVKILPKKFGVQLPDDSPWVESMTIEKLEPGEESETD